MAETASSRAEPNSELRSTVLIIDDDEDLRNSIGRLLRSVGLNAQLFASIPDFLKSESPKTPACLVLDIRLPGKSGLDFQRELATANIQLPIIFITGHGDIPTTVQAMKGGAIEFLTTAIPRTGPPRCHSARPRERSVPAQERDGAG